MFIRFKNTSTIVADLTKYPNPLRLFSQTRDDWFTDLVSNFEVPMHIFSAVRDTQLGQLMFAIETMRMKRKRAGEDPGPGLLEGENATMFIPLFKLIKQFQDAIGHEDLDLDSDDYYSSILSDDDFAALEEVHKQGQEWFTPLPYDRLDEIFLAATEVFRESLYKPLVEQFSGSAEELEEKFEEIDETFVESFYRIYDPDLATAIEEKAFERSEEEEKTRVFTIDEEEFVLSFNEYHGRVNLLYSFLLEMKRFVDDRENYGYDFEMLEPLLTLEMLLMLPQPDTSRLPLVKQHLSKLSENTAIPSAFLDLLSNSYQSYSRIEDSNRQVVRKLLSTLEKTMKESARTFWNQAKAKFARDDTTYTTYIATMWTHLRAIQSQAQYREQQTDQSGHSHSQSHAITVRLEHIFWVQGRFYHERDSYETPYQFWSAFAAIANKQIRSKEASLALFHELDELLTTTEILTDETSQKQLIANHADQYSLIQRILSYGLEARTEEIYPRVEVYVDLLEDLLSNIDPSEMHEGFDLEKEKDVVDDIRKHMKNPVSPNPQE